MENHNRVSITCYEWGNTTWFNISSRSSRFDLRDLVSEKYKETKSKQKLVDDVLHIEIDK